MNSLINPSLQGLSQSATLSINEETKRLMLQGVTVYRFGLGQSPFPVPAPVVNALRLHAPQKDYLPVKGLPALREAVAEFHRKKDGIDANPENVIIGPGSKELMFLLQLVFNGKIIVVSPCWVSYLPQAKILEKEISVIHSHFESKWLLSSGLFRKFLQERKENTPAFLILNYPGNPDGVTIEENELMEISELAKKNNIYILSDEIYGQLHHQGKHVSIGRYYPEGTVISSGLSKWCGAGGWRLGTFTFPENLAWLREKMEIVASETFTSVSAPIQFAAVHAFKGDTEIEEYLWHVRKILAGLGNKCAEILLKADVKTHSPLGGFYLFPDFSNYQEQFYNANIRTSAEFCKRLLKDTGVALLPGSSFAVPGNIFAARLAYVDFDGARALASARAVPLYQPLPENFINEHCSKLIEGVNRLVSWLKKL